MIILFFGYKTQTKPLKRDEVNAKMEFSISKMKETIKKQTDKRVSEDAARELSKDLENHGEEVTQKAIEHAEADDRVTVRAEDIRKALM